MDVMDPLTYDFSFSAYATRKTIGVATLLLVCSLVQHLFSTVYNLGSGCKNRHNLQVPGLFCWGGWKLILYIEMCVFVSDGLYLANS